MKRRKQTQTKRLKPLLGAHGSVADDGSDQPPNEQKAMAVGLLLVSAKYDGESAFDEGMRLLQQKLGFKP